MIDVSMLNVIRLPLDRNAPSVATQTILASGPAFLIVPEEYGYISGEAI
jgi:hypothetical protein